MKAAHSIVDDPNTSTHDRLHALSLFEGCSSTKLELISDASIVQQALQFIEESKKHIVEISQEKSNELLHMEEEGKQVQPTKQQQYQQEQESEEHQQGQEQQKTNNSIF